MLYIVAYDIEDPGRLKKTSRLCLDYGFRIQYSVFSMDFDEKRLHCFIQELKGMISLDTDRVMLIPICKNCSQSTFIFGKKSSLSLPDALVF